MKSITEQKTVTSRISRRRATTMSLAVMVESRGDLAVDEVERLAELEAVVEAGAEAFVRVGIALHEIRATRLYRGTHGTFEEYCKDRWGWSASRGRQLIGAAKAVTNGNALGAKTEREARRVAKETRDAKRPAPKIEDVIVPGEEIEIVDEGLNRPKSADAETIAAISQKAGKVIETYLIGDPVSNALKVLRKREADMSDTDLHVVAEALRSLENRARALALVFEGREKGGT